ncbi:hypothetical protein [Mesorhizobium sp. 8]|uniref:hypothetical protein n=1 Tax=Mesorhizobium sp. 8 TaxID=2584466 RepID=UPI0011232DBB|nr:hypothetical protein [Mesorhizobium sp. 8]QDC01402.1 hypothetical protein FGU64_13800 [Mesorhizobium sp. 8]
MERRIEIVGRLLSPRLVVGALALVLVAGVAHSAATRADVPKIAAATQAEALYPDAPDGVDPVVTGPVSVSFRQRQADAGCDEAVWPNVPAACYPN